MNEQSPAFVIDQSFEYRIKRQRRKTIALHVLADGTVELRAPTWLPNHQVAEFVERRSGWVLERRRKVLSALACKPTFENGQHHPFLGDSFPLRLTVSARGSVTFVDDAFLVSVRDKNDPDLISRAMDRWYREKAIALYEERLFVCFEHFPDWFQDKYVMPQITVRKMRRRWGSCSRKGEVTLNLALIKMPVSCIDYVIVHELCHLEVFHHGKAFYRLLSSVMPSWKQHEERIEQLA